MELEKGLPEVAKKNRRVGGTVLAVAIALAVTATLVLRSPAVRYGKAEAMLEQGEYAEAYQMLEKLGDYKDTQKILLYLDARELLTRETWQDAKELLALLGDYRDAPVLLEQLQRYEQACSYMTIKRYESAAEQFLSLGEFLDAAEKAERSQRLVVVNTEYKDGWMKFQTGEWLEAYRILFSIAGEEYEDTMEILDEITTTAEERIRYYAEQGERIKMLAFLCLMDEIDAGKSAALRQELVAAETFEADFSYYQLDPTPLTSCSSDTQAEEFVPTLVYMLLNGVTKITLPSDSELDKAAVLEQSFRAHNLVFNIIPRYASLYSFNITAEGNSIEIELSYDQRFSEERRNQLVEVYETFCEESLCELTEAGLLSASMSRKEKAIVISEWIGFYLTYDDMLEIHAAGEAVEKASGVCSAYAMLYHRMCNLAGIPTYAQGGTAYSASGSEGHIWLIHADEDGKIFYADPTWADSWEDDFSADAEKPTVAQFAGRYLERCLTSAVKEYKHNSVSAGQGNSVYLWSSYLWSSHVAGRTAKEIVAAHQRLLGES